MKITNKTKGIIDEGWRYRYEGDLVSEEEILIDLNKGLYVTGYIEAGGSITAGWSIKAGGSIEAGWYITAGGSIEAGGDITAGDGIVSFLHITADLHISAGKRIFAGVCNWQNIQDADKTITCSELRSGTIEYGILLETGKEPEDMIDIDGREYSKGTVKKALKEYFNND